MSGVGNKAVLVDCVACNATGRITALTRQFEAREITCERCRGSRKILVLRKRLHRASAPAAQLRMP